MARHVSGAAQSAQLQVKQYVAASFVRRVAEGTRHASRRAA
jgi:hypothetical protein